MRGMLGRVKRIDVVYFQAAIAASLSFSHIHEVAEAAGQESWQAWAYPVSVDLLLIAAWRKARREGGAGPWFWFIISLAASLGANIATAGVVDLDSPPMWLALLVAGWPAVALFGGTLLAHGGGKHGDPEPVDIPEMPEGEPDVQADEDEPDPVDDGPKIVTAGEAATALGVSASTVRGWARQERITTHGYDDSRRLLVDLIECAQIAQS